MTERTIVSLVSQVFVSIVSLACLVTVSSFCVTVAGLALAAPAAASTELLMVEEKGCPWCRKWWAEVGPAYPHTPEGRRAPLRVVEIRDPLLAGLELSSPVRGTPTFILLDNKREIGRITGYPGEAFFWSLLGELLNKVPPKQENLPKAQQMRLEMRNSVLVLP